MQLTAWPSTQTRKSLSPSRLATLYQAVSSCLSSYLELPPEKQDSTAARTFVSTYAKDSAAQTLQALIWESEQPELSKEEKSIRKKNLLVAERTASTLDIRTLLDLAITYARTSGQRTRTVFSAVIQGNSAALTTIKSELVPAFATLLSSGNVSGLYGVRKTAHCIKAFLHFSPPEVVRTFAHSQALITELAKAYDAGMGVIARSYGGFTGNEGEEDDWKKIWVATKVDLLDSFHICLSTLLTDIASTSGQRLAVEADQTFNILFALLEVPSTSSSSPCTPFLNQSLLGDYQHSYDLERTLSSSLKHADEKDARLDLIESSLRSLENEDNSKESPGVLKLLIRSSGMPPSIIPKGKGKAPTPVSEAAPSPDPGLDIKITAILDILPDHSPEYIKALLSHPDYPFRGNTEKVISALLEGTAPSFEDLTRSSQNISHGKTRAVEDGINAYVRSRQGVNEAMDMSRVTFGKKNESSSAFLADRTDIEQMKADILRRAEAFTDSEEEEAEQEDPDLEVDMQNPNIKISGDGEDENESESEEEPKESTEVILERAYIRDPALFNRDAKKSKGREELRTQTGWSDEQIEGWKIMLERDPKRRERLIQKYEFEAPQNHTLPPPGPASSSSRGRGHGRGGRGARGGGGRGGGSGGNEARDRARKDRRGNQDRRRGHDKKMAKAGGV
ncbi:hypothetical protein WG66_000227 [Moniliophthora roreri]|uniref:CUE domain-containing protein n=1 Tax=Moniliophthora roreri TaxID=221103 RepID=A0A0W0F0L3_MONRR|nr:hypothetical protein WG66_000227 [Moniliophthora roreri]